MNKIFELSFIIFYNRNINIIYVLTSIFSGFWGRKLIFFIIFLNTSQLIQ